MSDEARITEFPARPSRARAREDAADSVPDGERIKSFADRILSLRGDVKDIQSDMALVYAEAKSEGFDPKILKLLIRRLDSDPATLTETDSLLDLYETAYRQAERDASRVAP